MMVSCEAVTYSSLMSGVTQKGMYAHVHVGIPPPSRCGYIVYRDLTIPLATALSRPQPACLNQTREMFPR
jgi:hypothetical protein